VNLVNQTLFPGRALSLAVLLPFLNVHVDAYTASDNTLHGNRFWFTGLA